MNFMPYVQTRCPLSQIGFVFGSATRYLFPALNIPVLCSLSLNSQHKIRLHRHLRESNEAKTG